MVVGFIPYLSLSRFVCPARLVPDLSLYLNPKVPKALSLRMWIDLSVQSEKRLTTSSACRTRKRNPGIECTGLLLRILVEATILGIHVK